MSTASTATIDQLRSRIREIESGSTSCACSVSKEGISVSHDDSCNLPDGKIRPQKRVGSRGARYAAVSSALASDVKGGADVLRNVEPEFTEEQAFRKIERLACMREYACKAMRDRLVRAGYAEEVASAAIERAQRCGLLSDSRFADVLVRSRLSQGKGLQGIAAELSALDIDPCSVEEYVSALEQSEGPDELARALSLLDAKPPRGKRLRESAYRKLMQKGYGASIAASAARIWSEGHAAQ